jgi:hypothetical protein
MSLQSIGAKAFRDGMREQKQPYSIFAIKLPIENIIPELQERFRIEDWQQNIDRTGKLSDLVGVPVIKFKDSPWTVIYWSVSRYLDIECACGELSWTLDCSSIAIYEVDRSGYVEWKAFRNRDEAESVTRIPNSDTIYFESRLRQVSQDLESMEDKTLLRKTLDDLLDELLIKENIHILDLNLDLDNLDIERVDLLMLPSRPLGMRDFLNMIYHGHPECAIFAVKADIDRVIPVLTQGREHWLRDIKSEYSILDIVRQRWDESIDCIPILRPAHSEWTVVYWCLHSYMNLSSICSRVSAELETSIFTISEEDTSAAFGYKLFDRGKEVESVGCGDNMWFYSKIREEPEFDNFDKDERSTILEYINNRFIEEGIFIPTLDLSPSDPWIDRLDLL